MPPQVALAPGPEDLPGVRPAHAESSRGPRYRGQLAGGSFCVCLVNQLSSRGGSEKLSRGSPSGPQLVALLKKSQGKPGQNVPETLFISQSCLPSVYWPPAPAAPCRRRLGSLPPPLLPPSVPSASQLGDPDSAGPARQAAEQTDARPPGGDPSLSGVGVGGLHQTRL